MSAKRASVEYEPGRQKRVDSAAAVRATEHVATADRLALYVPTLRGKCAAVLAKYAVVVVPGDSMPVTWRPYLPLAS